MTSSLLGPFLFCSTAGIVLRRVAYASSLCTYSSHRVIDALEERVQRDEGNRGIKAIALHGELQRAAAACISSKNVVIITGFPCLLAFSPPTETDGPSGALAIARALLSLGDKTVTILTDECNEEVMLAGAAGSGLQQLYGDKFSLQSFPGMPEFDESDEKRLNTIADETDLLISIERTGPTKDGTYLTMRGFDMSAIVAPLDDIIARRTFGDTGTTVRTRPFTSIGIGDGGNEVGMGKIYSEILASTIPNAANIACVVPTEHLIVASVSNWGGYALAAAIALKSCEEMVEESELQSVLSKALVSRQDEINIVRRIVDAGARDGITKEKAMMVDGFPLEMSLDVLDDLRNIAAKSKDRL